VRLLYHNFGPASLAGQEIGVQYLRSLPYVDASRIGIWGWSFGGFETAYALTHTTLFKAGAAGAPVTDWHLYDTIYTERYMGTPQSDAKYLVVTAVDRDDLPDGGALIFANTVRAIHERVEGSKVEILSGDYRGDVTALDIVLDAEPDVFAHNLETVRRLTPRVRDKRANYDQSLRVLEHAKQRAPERFTKTSLMLGLGESDEEVEQAMDDARSVGVDIFTMGQYLQPTKKHLPVETFVTPEKFAQLGQLAKSKGFHQVVSSPLSRSSYHAEQAFH
jgi:lipoate synthase